MDMAQLTGNEAAVITGIIAAIAPATAAVWKWYELQLAKQRQTHEIALATQRQNHDIALAQAAQVHKITTEYLDRALKPETPIAIRHALLRFLAADSDGEHRLRTWANSELETLKPVVMPIQQAVERALVAVNNASDEKALQQAQVALRLAQSKERDLLGPAPQPPRTAAAIRAGFIETGQELPGLNMTGEDLHGSKFPGAKMVGANFSKANLSTTFFIGGDVRGASFEVANVSRTAFYETDLRGANFSGADLRGSNFEKARAEKANFSGAIFENTRLVVTFDHDTVWPDGFDPEAHGAVPDRSPGLFIA
jgi:hypothetical protein